MFKLTGALCLIFGFALLASEPAMVEPKFTAGNELVRPTGYHEWIFLGSSLGMGYQRSGGDKNEPTFHNVYTQPEAYRAYLKTGKFPDKTIMILELMTAGANASINKEGHFEDRLIGIEASVKDVNRFPEKWAYFNFIGNDRKPLVQSKAFAKQTCWSCHDEHAAVDNVFEQFYPVLREAKQKQ